MITRTFMTAAALAPILLSRPAAAAPEKALFSAEAILHAKPGQADTLLVQLEEIRRGTRDEPDNLAYDIHQSVRPWSVDQEHGLDRRLAEADGGIDGLPVIAAIQCHSRRGRPLLHG